MGQRIETHRKKPSTSGLRSADPFHEEPNGLNPTEQYFNLFEAAFRFGRDEMIGEPGSSMRRALWVCLGAWRHITQDGSDFKDEDSVGLIHHAFYGNWYLLALMDLFGLARVDLPPAPVTKWQPPRVEILPFGDALLKLIWNMSLGLSDDDSIDEDDGQDEDGLDDSFEGFSVDEKADEDDDEYEDEDEAEDEVSGEVEFGAWQSLFQPFFPEWQRNLEFPRQKPREGMFIFHVSLDDVWRLIAIPSTLTLDELAREILKSVNFDNDHLYEFRYADRLGAMCAIHSPQMNEGPLADEVNVSQLPLEPGQRMEFHFDFGDD